MSGNVANYCSVTLLVTFYNVTDGAEASPDRKIKVEEKLINNICHPRHINDSRNDKS
jgi:hypothetical protein